MEIKKKNVGAMLVGEWNTKTIVAVAIGAALFGVLMCYGGIPIFTNTSLTTAMIIPVIVGALFGPLPAMVCCGVGNVIADLIGGWGLVVRLVRGQCRDGVLRWPAAGLRRQHKGRHIHR